jgi:hypothetical protein
MKAETIISKNLIDGVFNNSDSIEILTRLIATKIKFHEDTIKTIENIEDIKMKESRIKQLQKELYEIRHILDHEKKQTRISLSIEIE